MQPPPVNSPCTDELKTKLPEEARDHFSALAALAGMTTSEYLRRVVMNHMYGHLYMIQASQGVQSE